MDKNKTYLLMINVSARGGKVAVKSLQKIENSQKRVNTQAKKGTALSGQFVKALKRVAIVVPVWALTRAVIRGVTQSLRFAVENFVKLDDALARIKTVMHGTASDVDTQMRIIKGVILDTSKKSRLSIQELSEGFYFLKTANLDARESIEAFDSVVSLSVGTQNSMADSARAVAGIYNTMGKYLGDNLTVHEKFAKIGDVLAYTYATQDVQLSELIQSYTKLAPYITGLSDGFTELTTMLGFLNTRLLRGGRTGRLTGRAILQLTKNAKQLADQFGITFDPDKPISLLKTIDQIHKAMGLTGKATAEQSQMIQEVFATRGGVTIRLLLEHWDDLNEQIKEAITNVDGYNKKMEAIKMDTIAGQAARLKNIFSSLFDTFLTSAVGAENLAEAIEKIGDNLEGLETTMRVIGSITRYNLKLIKGVTDGIGSTFNYIDDKIRDISNFTSENIIGGLMSEVDKNLSFDSTGAIGFGVNFTDGIDVASKAIEDLKDKANPLIEQIVEKSKVDEMFNYLNRKFKGFKDNYPGFFKVIDFINKNLAKANEKINNFGSKIYKATNKTMEGMPGVGWILGVIRNNKKAKETADKAGKSLKELNKLRTKQIKINQLADRAEIRGNRENAIKLREKAKDLDKDIYKLLSAEGKQIYQNNKMKESNNMMAEKTRDRMDERTAKTKHQVNLMKIMGASALEIAKYELERAKAHDATIEGYNDELGLMKLKNKVVEEELKLRKELIDKYENAQLKLLKKMGASEMQILGVQEKQLKLRKKQYSPIEFGNRLLDIQINKEIALQNRIKERRDLYENIMTKIITADKGERQNMAEALTALLPTSGETFRNAFSNLSEEAKQTAFEMRDIFTPDQRSDLFKSVIREAGGEVQRISKQIENAIARQPEMDIQKMRTAELLVDRIQLRSGAQGFVRGIVGRARGASGEWENVYGKVPATKNPNQFMNQGLNAPTEANISTNVGGITINLPAGTPKEVAEDAGDKIAKALKNNAEFNKMLSNHFWSENGKGRRV